MYSFGVRAMIYFSLSRLFITQRKLGQKNINMENHGSKACVCSSAGCMCGHHDGHSYLMKWLMRLALLLVVFALGFMMGQLHTMVRAHRYAGPYFGGVMMDTRLMSPEVMEWNDTPDTPTSQTDTQ